MKFAHSVIRIYLLLERAEGLHLQNGYGQLGHRLTDALVVITGWMETLAEQDPDLELDSTEPTPDTITGCLDAVVGLVRAWDEEAVLPGHADFTIALMDARTAAMTP